MATAVETAKNIMNVLKKYSQDESEIGVIALNDAIRTATTFSSLDEAKKDLVARLKDTETYPDSDTRLKEATGMVLSVDFTSDTGAITGHNAGGSTVKDSKSIVPEDDVDLSTLPLPEPGSTTPITYTGDDGKTFTFYVKWPDSFTTIVHGYNISSIEEMDPGLLDSRNYVDLAQFNPDDSYTYVTTNDDGSTETATYPSYGTIIQRMSTILKGLNNYWLKEGAKLDYDSLGLTLDGQTIEIIFMGGSFYDLPTMNTFAFRKDYLPSNQIGLSINVVKSNYDLSTSDPNGAYLMDYSFENNGEIKTIKMPGYYLDRVIAHELVHAVMYATGTIKKGMPEFFTEGIAEVVQGNDDFLGYRIPLIQQIVESPSLLEDALNLGEGTGGTYTYPGGNMFMRFIAKQSLDVTPIIGDSSQSETFNYDTKSAVITNYDENDSINFNKDVKDYSISAAFNDFQIESADDGIFVVRDARGKLMTLNTSGGTEYAYMLPGSNEIDGRNINGGNNFEILFGSNHENDVIRAGNGGSQLWGGISGNDEIFGGSGQDTFVYKFNGDHDNFQNVESQDVINFGDMTLDKISGAVFTDSGSYFKFSDGGSLIINGQPSTFVVSNDNNTTTYRADYQNKTWTQV